MNTIVYILLESALLVIALSTDAFLASLAYGSNKIKIPWVSAQVIAFICTGILGISILLGSLLKGFLPSVMLKYISFTILMILGIIKLMDNLIKAIINKFTSISKEIKFTMFSLNIILNIYANPNEADIDKSKTLSPKEAFSLAVALSLDSIAAGFGAAMGNTNIIAVLLFSFFFSILSIKTGEFVGNKVSNKIPFISWLGGILLIIIALVRFI